MFKDSCTNINDLTDVVSCYASYCVDNVIPDKIVQVYPNNKPWVRKSLKLLLNKKRQAFREGNFLELNELKKEIRIEIRRAKQGYKEKIEKDFGGRNLCSAWDGMRTVIGTRREKNVKVVLEGFSCDSLLATEQISILILWDGFLIF